MAAVIAWLAKVAGSVIAWAVAHPTAAVVITVALTIGAAYARESEDPLLRSLGYIVPGVLALLAIGVTVETMKQLWTEAGRLAAERLAALLAEEPGMLWAPSFGLGHPTLGF